jgi:hypothetical protein
MSSTDNPWAPQPLTFEKVAPDFYISEARGIKPSCKYSVGYGIYIPCIHYVKYGEDDKPQQMDELSIYRHCKERGYDIPFHIQFCKWYDESGSIEVYQQKLREEVSRAQSSEYKMKSKVNRKYAHKFYRMRDNGFNILADNVWVSTECQLTLPCSHAVILDYQEARMSGDAIHDLLVERGCTPPEHFKEAKQEVLERQQRC